MKNIFFLFHALISHSANIKTLPRKEHKTFTDKIPSILRTRNDLLNDKLTFHNPSNLKKIKTTGLQAIQHRKNRR